MWVFLQNDAIHLLTESPTVLTVDVAEDLTLLYHSNALWTRKYVHSWFIFTYTTMMSQKMWQMLQSWQLRTYKGGFTVKLMGIKLQGPSSTRAFSKALGNTLNKYSPLYSILYSFSQRGPQKLYKLKAPQNLHLPVYIHSDVNIYMAHG